MPTTEYKRATHANWRTAPYSRWAFRNTSTIIPVADIETAPGDVSALSEALQPLDGFSLSPGDGTTLGLDAFLGATATDGMIVLQDGNIAFEFYADGMAAGTRHILMSASKSITGLIAGILVGDGVLALDACASDYLPEIANTAYAAATIRQLLDMRTGFVPDEEELRSYAAAGHWEPVAAEDARPGLHGFFTGLGPRHEPHGGPFRYISANTDLLGWIMERASGRRFADLASESLWRPMGAEHAAAITVDRDGAPRCTGGFCATLRDFARIGQLVLQDGRRGARQIVPEAWLRDMAENGDDDAWRDGQWGAAFAPISPAMRYRSFWYAVDEEPQLLFAMGIHGQNLFVDRANRIVIAKFSAQASLIDFRAIMLTHRAISEIRRCLLGRA